MVIRDNQYIKTEGVKMKNVLELVGTEVKVRDTHYRDTIVDSMVLAIKDANGNIKDVAAMDSRGYIFRLDYSKINNELVLINSVAYGQMKDGKVEGWCYDRDGYSIDGYESTGYYKPAK